MMKKFSSLKNKGKASFIHLSVTAIIFIITTVFIRYIWFPSLHFQINGGVQGLKLMFFIDIVLGPLLTFIIYNKSKSNKEKYFDFSLIGAIQLSALIYGFYTIHNTKPTLLLFENTGQITTINNKEYNNSYSQINLSELSEFTDVPSLYRDAISKSANQFMLPESIEFIQKSSEKYKNFLSNEGKEAWKIKEKEYTVPVILLSMVGTHYKAKVVVDSENIKLVDYFDKSTYSAPVVSQ